MRTPLWTVLAALLLSSCSGAPRTLVEPDVRAALKAAVSEVDSAARRHDRVASEFALAELTRGIAEAQARGRLDPAYARSLLTAADRVAEDVATLPLPAPPPPVVVTVPGEPPAPGQVVTAPGTTVKAPPDATLPPGQAKKQTEAPQQPVPNSPGSPPANEQNGQSGDNVGTDQSQNGQGNANGRGTSGDQGDSDGQGDSGGQ
ncbi:hypothetical protein [Saccharopolyspora sp. NPDC002578]